MTAILPTTPSILRYQEERSLDRVLAYHTGLQVRLREVRSAYLALSATEFAIFLDKPDQALHYDLEGRLVKVSEPDRYRRRSLSHRVLLTRKFNRDEAGLTRMVLSAEEADRLVEEAHRIVREIILTAQPLEFERHPSPHPLPQGERIPTVTRSPAFPLPSGGEDEGEGEFRNRTGNAWRKIQPGVSWRIDPAEIEFAKPETAEAVRRLTPLLERAAAFDVRAAHENTALFHTIYGRVAVLPPDQYNALVLQVTEGCAYAGCLFCELYSQVPFRKKTPEAFRAHVADAIAFHGAALKARRSIFLGEANALTLPHEELVDRFRILREHFEFPSSTKAHVPADWWLGSATRFDGVCSFMDAFKQPRSIEEYAELRALGLRRVYLGMETGDDALLEWLQKPATAANIERCVRTLKNAGTAVGLVVLLGAGGRQFAESHVVKTARLLNNLPLDKHDYIYFSPLVIHPHGKYTARAMAQGTECLSDEQMRRQESEIRARLRFDPSRGRPYLAHYELETFVY